MEKASPATAQQLFGNNQLTFSSLLQQYKNGKAAADNYKGRYDEYRDKLTTSLKYIEDSSARSLIGSGSEIKSLATAKEKVSKLNVQLKNTEAVQNFIKERKKQLAQQAVQVISKSKYLQKINKESYYYVQALGNYKETFSDPKKTEALAMKVLEKIPAFNDFIKKNSMLASLFRMPGDGNDVSSLAGLQTRAQVNGMIQQQIAAGGPNALQQFRDNLQSAQSQLAQLKDKVLKAGGGSSDMEMPEGFKPNDQKTKSFFKRLEYGTNVQTQKATAYFPVTSDLGLSVGYKLNDKSIIGIGASYKLGFGRGWNNIRMSQQGAGLRSFIDWKIKGSFWVSGGYEMNYKTAFNSVDQLQNLSAWQTSGLIGLSKSIPVKTKFFKKTKIQLLWDFMSYQQLPRTQPIVFRVGYSIK